MIIVGHNQVNQKTKNRRDREKNWKNNRVYPKTLNKGWVSHNLKNSQSETRLRDKKEKLIKEILLFRNLKKI